MIAHLAINKWTQTCLEGQNSTISQRMRFGMHVPGEHSNKKDGAHASQAASSDLSAQSANWSPTFSLEMHSPFSHLHSVGVQFLCTVNK